MDPTLLLLPAGLLQGAILIIAACYAGSHGGKPNNLLGIRLWSTTFSETAWQTGHRVGLKYSWALLGLAILSLGTGIWLVQSPTDASPAVETIYTLGSLLSFLLMTLLMVYKTHRAAKAIAIAQVLSEDAELIEAIVDRRLAEQDAQS